MLLQVDWLIDYEPAWLGPVIMILGLLLIISWYINYISGEHAMLTAVGLITLLCAVPWMVQNRQIIVVVLSIVGSWFQGVGVVRGYLKLTHYFRVFRKKIGSRLFGYGDNQIDTKSKKRNKNGQSGMKSAIEWLVFQLLGLLAVIMSIWILLGLTIASDFAIQSLTNDVIITWTLLTTFGAVLGLGWRFWSVRESFPSVVLLGVIFLASGAEIYNIRTLGGEVIVFLISRFVFFLGFLAAVSVLVLTRQPSESHVESDTTNRIADD